MLFRSNLNIQMESTLKTPPPRAQSMLCRISDNKFILIAGANRTEHFGDAWLLQPDPKGNKWVHLNTSTLPRSGHSGGGDSDRLYFFGGQNVHADQLYNDVGMFDCKSLTMKQDNYDSANVGKHKSFKVVWCEMLCSRETYRVRIVHSGGDRNQTSDQTSKSSVTEGYDMSALLNLKLLQMF